MKEEEKVKIEKDQKILEIYEMQDLINEAKTAKIWSQKDDMKR